MELEYFDKNLLTPRGKLKGKINFRPNLSILFVFFFGLFLIFMTRQIAGIVAGLFCIGVAVVFFWKVKDAPVMDIYEQDIILYDPDDQNRAACLPVNEIKEFFVQRDNSAMINFRTNDETVFTVKSLRSANAYSLLAKVLPGKGSDDKNLQRQWKK